MKIEEVNSKLITPLKEKGLIVNIMTGYHTIIYQTNNTFFHIKETEVSEWLLRVEVNHVAFWVDLKDISTIDVYGGLVTIVLENSAVFKLQVY
jgi:hypothetical protein